MTESPVGVEYSFTTLGEKLEAPITALYERTSKYSSDVLDAKKSFDAKRVSLKSTTKARSKTMGDSNR
jgi:DNA-binding HxlR family transcriptional regulator